MKKLIILILLVVGSVAVVSAQKKMSRPEYSGRVFTITHCGPTCGERLDMIISNDNDPDRIIEYSAYVEETKK